MASFCVKPNFGFDSVVTLPLIFDSLREKKKKSKLKENKLLLLGWEAVAPHHLVAALKSQPEIPVVARRLLNHTVWFCQGRTPGEMGQGHPGKHSLCTA